MAALSPAAGPFHHRVALPAGCRGRLLQAPLGAGASSRARRLGREALAVEAYYDLGTRCLSSDGVDSTHAQASIEELRRRLLRVPDLPVWRGRGAADDEDLLWWFLRDRRLDVTESAKKLERCLRWRRDFRVDRLGPELFAKELRMRKAYLHPHADLAGRPVIVAIARKHNVLERNLLDSCRMCAWFMERTLDKLEMVAPPGSDHAIISGAGRKKEPVEQALGIFDLRGFSPLQADLEFATFLVELLHLYYPGRFGRILFIEAPEVFGSFWDTVRPLLGHYASLADFVTLDEVRRHYFAPGHMPEELQRR